MKAGRITALLAALIISAALPAGVCADEWTQTADGYVYTYSDGTTAGSGWLKADGGYYYIQKDGTRKTGWLSTTGGKCYFGRDGRMYTNVWVSFSDGKKYYFRSNGTAATGVEKIGKTEYKFDENGCCLGENHHFILNTDSRCLHGSAGCRAVKMMDKNNYSEIDIGEDEMSDYIDGGCWTCSISGCNKDIIF